MLILWLYFDGECLTFSSTAKEATKSKIETIITKQFGQEIENKKEEIINISEVGYT